MGFILKAMKIYGLPLIIFILFIAEISSWICKFWEQDTLYNNEYLFILITNLIFMKKRTDFQKFKMNGHIENQSSRLMKTIEEGSIVDDDSITAYPKLSNLPKKVESNRKLDLFTIFFHQFTNSLNNKFIIYLLYGTVNQKS